jgi:hypothetical protein
LKPLHVIPDKQRLQGSWVAKKMQSFVAGRPSLGLAKKVWMQLISPWRRGEKRSLLDSIVMGARVARERMAAPKSLQPSETRERVRGTMWDSVRERKVEMRVVGVDMVGWGRKRLLDGMRRLCDEL